MVDHMLAFYMSLMDDEAMGDNFEILYRKYRKQMFLVARSILDNDAEAEDAVHDVFVKVATRHMPTLQAMPTDMDRRNYLLSAAKNAAINLTRKRGRNAIPLELIPNMTDDLDDDAFLEQVLRNIAYDRVFQAIQRLGSPYREVLYYHFVVELSLVEVAKLLDRKHGVVKMQAVRGKKRLLAALWEKEAV